MLIIEKAPLLNGAHRNQTGIDFVPDGWVAVPEGMEEEATSYLPFIELEYGGDTLLSVSQGTVPEPEPVPEPVDPIEEIIGGLTILLKGK